jgi:hypothetical protein
MKVLGVIVASLCALPTSAAEIEFAGYAVVSGEQLFSIHKPDKKEFSPWLKIGQEWSGYKTVSFEESGEKLTLSKDGREQALWLRAAEIGRELTMPYLVKGSFTLLDGTVVYSEDAVVKVGPVFVSAVAGALVSDKEQTQLVGDFKMSADTFEATFENGRVTKEGGDVVVVTADKLTVENKD